MIDEAVEAIGGGKAGETVPLWELGKFFGGGEVVEKKNVVGDGVS